MRTATNILINNNEYLLQEFTVKDIFLFYQIVNDLDNTETTNNLFQCFFNLGHNNIKALLSSITACPISVLTELPISEIHDLVQSILKQNHQFFSKKLDHELRELY